VGRPNGVRQTLDAVWRIGVEEHRSASVERQLKGDRNPLDSRVVHRGDQGRQGPELPLTGANRLTIERCLCSYVVDRTAHVLDGPVQGGGDPTPDITTPQMIGAKLMGPTDRWPNPCAEVRIEARGLHEGKQSSSDGAAARLPRSPCE